MSWRKNLCNKCGYFASPICQCATDHTEKEETMHSAAYKAAQDAVQAWKDAGTEGAKAAGTLDGCPICGKTELHWCQTRSGRYAFLRDEFGNRISSHYLPSDFPMPEMPENAAPDMVNHPPHYTSGAVECIDAIHAALGDDGFVAFCRGNAIKYIWRTGKKGDAVQDMEKAVWYITKAVEVARER